MNSLTGTSIKSLLKERKTASNKGDHGHALLFAGKSGMMGTAVIAAKACLRSGTGLLTVCVPHAERAILQVSIPEAILMLREERPYKLDRFSAIGIGPGIGTDALAEESLLSMMDQSAIPLVLDADALTILSQSKKFLKKVPPRSILTPHAGEFDRLFGLHTSREQRIKTATEQATEHGTIIVLKGPDTAIITADEVWYNITGNPGLAKGGSGDALTGLITSLMAQGYDPPAAAKLGVYLHGLAADITLNQQSVESMLITDVIENFGKAFEIIRS